jgi:hypothetical protein
MVTGKTSAIPLGSWARGLLALYALVAAACQSVPSPRLVASAESPVASSSQPAPTTTRLHALLINGGGRPAQNYQSHLLHVRELLALLLQAGVRPEQISIFNADGSDPAADLAVRET